MTYGELDDITTRFANHLSRLGVRPEHMVPFCLEKSRLPIIAMIGIMKAGGIFVPLDPAHPANRRRDIVRDINAQLIIASPSTRAACVNMASKVVVLSDSLLSELRGKTTYNSTSLKPMHHNAAYMLFTSGTTGKPKGIVVEHAAICTSLLAQGKFFGLSEKTRYLQFASYVFDASISEVFSTLLYGGTVCVPSDTERLQQTAKFITAAKVNTALLTPSFVRTLSPAQVPTLTTLVVGGEAPAKDTLRTWQPSVKLINAYGPTEACIACAAHVFKSMDESPTIIGQNFAGPNWIVEPDDHNKLTPVGCVGELLVQGHALARGYLNDWQKTDAAFIDNVSWLPEALEKNKSRFYKTGDLVRYKAPGILEYVGRRDSQLKLRGQRMEVAEVEYAIKSVADNVEHVAVELVSTDSGDALVALITFREKSSETMRKNSSRHLDMTEKLKQTISERVEALRQVLPQYMVPTYFIPLADMPFVSSMKVDRKELRRLVSTLTPESLSIYSLNSGEKIKPTTDMEARMRDLWAQVLRVNPDTIGTNDSFLQIGGDSITAIQLVCLAQQSGISLAVADVFADSRLSHLASVATTDDAVQSYNPEPFDLVQSAAVEAVLVGVDDSSSLPHMQMIEDIYPCTSLQEGLLSLSVRQPGSYIGKFIYRLSPNADIPRFKWAWERTVELCGSLRTSIVLAGQHTYQAILKSSGCHWDMKEDGLTITDYLESLRSIKMQYGKPLTRYALVGNSTEGYYFALAIHHAVLDGWSHDLVMSMLLSLYAGQDANIPPSYAGFIQYTQNIDKSTATDFWRGQLLGARRATFPPSPPAAASAGPTGVFSMDIDFPDMASMSITKATILRAAWAVVIARYCDSDDVCFGATVSGRHATVHRLGEMVGPVFATVPVRVCLNSESTVLDFLQRIQKQASDMIDFEQFGLQNIAKIDQAAKEACDFTSLLVIQPVQGVEDVDTSSSDPLFDSNWVPQDFLQDSLQQYFTYPLVTDCFMYKNRVGLQFTYRSDLLSYDLLEGLAEQFRHVVGQLAQPDDRLLKQVSVAGPWDLAKAKDMNKEEHPVLPVRIHQLITHRANRIPDKQAIYTSGGTMTYAHLNKTCNALAAHLTTLGVGAEIMVPFCFEKSMWAVVAMLSIMKAGGVFVPLDPSHPRSRREDVVRETGANVMLVSPKTKSSCIGLTSHIIELTPDFIAQLHKVTIAQTEVKEVAPSNAAYVLFTSGSTAKPKAIVVDHAALSMSIMGYDRVYSLDKTSRVLQFSTYVFDVSLSEILETLTFGGTVCIPTDEERMEGLHTFISSANVNTAMLTPSYLRTVDPEAVPSIQRLLLVGEPAAKDTLETWVGRTEVINAYGPSESSIFCTSHLYTSPAETPTNIGRAFSGACWIVEPGNPSQLAPIGCVGEILLQRRMARGYLNDPKLTKEVFIDSVPWLKKKSSDSRKFHLTGDLGRFNQDGTIEYLGRRDTQVKVRGYRIELGEIEYRIKTSMSNIHQVAVDVIRQDSRESLAAFISFKDKSVGSPREGSDTPLMRIDDQLRDSFSALADELRQALPSYMVPELLIPLLEIPANTSLKIDRPALRRLADVLTSSVLSEYTLASHHKTPPVNDSERQLQSMWAKVLGVDPETIGRNDSFLQVGGDSIAAIRLTTIAQQQGLQLTVPMVFESPRLCDMALKTSSITENMEYNAASFSLVPSSEADILKSTIRARCHLRVDQEIEDIYPCTGGQEFYMKSAIERPGSYTAKRIYKLSSHVDIARFRSAFAQVMNTYALMRTRIISHQGRSVQAVISNDVTWDDEIMELTSVESYLSSMEQNTMGYDNKLCHYAIIRNGNDFYLIWVLHHSIFDEWSTGILLTALHLAYRDVAIPAVVPYSRFIKYVYSRDDEVSKQFWLSKLSGAKRCQFPSLPTSTTSDAKNITLFATYDIQLPSNHIKSSPATVATVVRAAWAMMLGKRGSTQDVTFSETVSGRQAPVMGLSNIAGPVLARVPMRVRLNAGQTPSQLLDTLQAQAAEMVAHEQYGISKIAKLTPEIADVCNFSSHLIIQPAEIVGSAETRQEGVQPLLKPESADYNSLDGYYSYPLVTHALVGSENIKLYFIYQEPVLTEKILSAVYDDIKEFVHTLYQ
jgi:amino acid adenylation domain-containing protein